MNWIAIVIFTLFVRTTLLAQRTVDIRQFKADGDDDAAMLRRALKSQQHAIIYFPAGLTVNASGSFDVPAGLSLQGSGRLVGTRLMLGGNAAVSGLTLEGAQAGLVIASDGQQDNETIQSVTFRNVNTAIQIPAGQNGKTAHNITILDNICNTCSVFVYSDKVDNSTISHNTAHVSERGVLLFGGSNNRILQNTIDGGVTGVSFVYNLATAGETGVVLNNVIERNTISNVHEESISFDTRGNEPDKMATREIDLIAAIEGPAIVLQSSGWTGVGAQMHHLYICWLTGSIKGSCIHSTGGNDARFVLDASPSQMAEIRQGDSIVVGAPFLGNAIYGNVISINSSYTLVSGILLWGMSYGNLVCGNTVWSDVPALGKVGIGVFSLNGLDPTHSVTNPKGGRKAPSEENLVAQNHVKNLKLELGYQDWGKQIHFPSVGNRLIGNTVTDGLVQIKDQAQANGVQDQQSSVDAHDYGTTDLPVQLLRSMAATSGNTFCNSPTSVPR